MKSEETWRRIRKYCRQNGTVSELHDLYKSNGLFGPDVGGRILGTASIETPVQIAHTDSQFTKKTMLRGEDREAERPSYFCIVTGGEQAPLWDIEHPHKWLGKPATTARSLGKLLPLRLTYIPLFSRVCSRGSVSCRRRR